jgi:elongation factor G
MKEYASGAIRNVALAGHGGSGKTTLAEACLHIAGASERMGSVDDGNTVSDFLPEEINSPSTSNRDTVHDILFLIKASLSWSQYPV